MSAAIPPIAPISPHVAPIDVARTTPRVDLGSTFGDLIAEARNRENVATEMAERFAAGDTSVGIHEVMIASEKANLALRFATTMKNKAIEAYRELINTQV
jgi:flagellar hook-basal body complex protein FliE